MPSVINALVFVIVAVACTVIIAVFALGIHLAIDYFTRNNKPL